LLGTWSDPLLAGKLCIAIGLNDQMNLFSRRPRAYSEPDNQEVHAFVHKLDKIMGLTAKDTSLKVTALEKKGAAATGGVKIGDTITSVGGVDVSTMSEVGVALADCKGRGDREVVVCCTNGALPARRRRSEGSLGAVKVRTFVHTLGQPMGLSIANKSLQVTALDRRGAAAAGGLKVGDKVTAIGEVEVSSISELKAALDGCKAKSVSEVIVRCNATNKPQPLPPPTAPSGRQRRRSSEGDYSSSSAANALSEAALAEVGAEEAPPPRKEAAESFKALKRRALESEDADAQHELGLFYHRAAVDADANGRSSGGRSSGNGSVLGLEAQAEALKCWQLAAEQGHVEAAVALGTACYTGKGPAALGREGGERAAKSVSSSLANAKGVVALAADPAPAPAVPSEDLDEAVRLWVEAARLGSPRAITNLACAYLDGVCVQRSPAMAAALLERAVALGSTHAQVLDKTTSMSHLLYAFLVYFSFLLLFDVSVFACPSFSLRAPAFSSAIFSASFPLSAFVAPLSPFAVLTAVAPNQQVILGHMCHQGTVGFPADKEKAFTLFRQAAAAGNLQAQEFANRLSSPLPPPPLSSSSRRRRFSSDENSGDGGSSEAEEEEEEERGGGSGGSSKKGKGKLSPPSLRPSSPPLSSKRRHSNPRAVVSRDKPSSSSKHVVFATTSSGGIGDGRETSDEESKSETGSSRDHDTTDDGESLPATADEVKAAMAEALKKIPYMSPARFFQLYAPPPAFLDAAQLAAAVAKLTRFRQARESDPGVQAVFTELLGKEGQDRGGVPTVTLLDLKRNWRVLAGGGPETEAPAAARQSLPGHTASEADEFHGSSVVL